MHFVIPREGVNVNGEGVCAPQFFSRHHAEAPCGVWKAFLKEGDTHENWSSTKRPIHGPALVVTAIDNGGVQQKVRNMTDETEIGYMNKLMNIGLAWCRQNGVYADSDEAEAYIEDSLEL